MKQNYFITGILLITITCFFGACGGNNNEWKKPTDVGITVDINRDTNTAGTLHFEIGYVVLAAFDIEGERAQAADVVFSKSFAQGHTIPFEPNTPIAELDFDIPQGTYSRIDISFETFDDGVQPNLVVEGTYATTGGTNRPVRFEFKSGEYFSIVAEDDNGANTIVLDKSVPANAQIKFDPVFWFQNISTNRMENANLTDVDGVPTILIKEDKNSDIYDDLADRIDKQTEIVFRPL